MSRSLKIVAVLGVAAAVLTGYTMLSGSDSSTANAAGRAPSLPAATQTPPLPTSPNTQPSPNSQSPAPIDTPRTSRTEFAARSFAAGIVNLDERRLTTSDDKAVEMTSAVASVGSREILVAQTLRQSALLRTEFGPATTWFDSALRARTITYSDSKAVVDVWWVKVVSSPSRPTAGDIWGTTRFTLVWESESWRVANEESHLGPWPTHSRTEVNHPTGAVFTAELTGFEPIMVLP